MLIDRFLELYRCLGLLDEVEFIGSKEDKTYSTIYAYRDLIRIFEHKRIEDFIEEVTHLVQGKFREYFNLEEPDITIKGHFLNDKIKQRPLGIKAYKPSK